MKLVTLKLIDDITKQSFQTQRILIEDFDDLFEYFEKVKSTRTAGAIESLLAGKYDDVINKDGFRKENTEAYMLSLCHKYSGTNLLDSSLILNNKVAAGMLKSLQTGRSLIVNKAGGYCFLDLKSKVIEIRKQDFAPVEFLITKVV